MQAFRNPSSALASAITYPVLDNGLLIDSPRIAWITEVRGDQITIELSGHEPPVGPSLAVGAYLPNGSRAFFGAVIHADAASDDLRSLTVSRGGVGERILAEEGRVPVLPDREFRFARAFSDAVYTSWEHAGLLRRRVLDKVLVCPKCSSVPTFRFGCQHCGAGNIDRPLMVHHFACAWVAPLEQFQTDTTLQCPKCQTKHLIAGTDFEYTPAQHHCQSCGWKANELEQTGHCIHCDFRFPIHQAIEQDMVGYDADRLDSLALFSNLE